MFRTINSLFSFLTIIPINNSNYEITAKNMHFFPIVGIIIGIVISIAGFYLSLFLPSLLVGFFVTFFICMITGLHHIDGLSDFADGIMTKGTIQKKLAAMDDPFTGIAGTVIVTFYIIGMILIISMFDGVVIFKAIILSEVAAKFSMVLQATISSSAKYGCNSIFIKNMKNKKLFLVSMFVSIVPAILLAGVSGLLLILIVSISVYIIKLISEINFGGISGDTFGATNELTRLLSLCVFIII